MAALITSIIGDQAFELIRERIGLILTEELANQYTLTNNQALFVSTFIERFVPFDHEELPGINILFSKGEYPLKTTDGRVNGNYHYNIDCYTKAASTSTDYGDTLASIKLQNLMGKIRAILENPVYKTLAFAPGIVMSTGVVNMHVFDPQNEKDLMNMAVGRLVFGVKAVETVSLLDRNLIAGYKSSVKLVETEKGYTFTKSE